MVVSHMLQFLCSPLPPVVLKSPHFPLHLGLDFSKCTLAPLRVLLKMPKMLAPPGLPGHSHCCPNTLVLRGSARVAIIKCELPVCRAPTSSSQLLKPAAITFTPLPQGFLHSQNKTPCTVSKLVGVVPPPDCLSASQCLIKCGARECIEHC